MDYQNTVSGSIMVTDRLIQRVANGLTGSRKEPSRNWVARTLSE